MAINIAKHGLTFDDVLLIPKYSAVKSRKEVDLSVDLGKGIKLDIPIVSANMKTVTGPEMANAIARLGGLGILHRFQSSLNERVSDYNEAIKGLSAAEIKRVGVSVGVHKSELDFLNDLYNLNIVAMPSVICVDVAHGDSLYCERMVDHIHYKYPDVLLIAGNVATASGAFNLANRGADVIKANVGSGSLCTTRIQTGNGVPALTTIIDIDDFREKNNYDFKLICDGGLRSAGDIVKSLCFADAVMLGNLLAGTDEAPGQIINKDGLMYKTYAGSSTHKDRNIEGVAGLVPCRGPVAKSIEKLLDGIRSGCSYQGVSNLEDLKKNPEFVSISNAGLVESHPHDIRLV